MFCGKCGAQIPEGADFCPQCGNAVKKEGTQPVYAGPEGTVPEPAAPEKKNKNKIIGIAAVAAVAGIAVIVVLVLVFSGRGYEKTVEKYMDCSLEGDVEGILDLMPEELVDVALDELGMDREELAENFSGTMSAWMGIAEENDMDISYEIMEEEDLSKKELRDLVEQLEDTADVSLDVKEAKTVEVEVTVEYEGDKNRQDLTLTLGKIGRSWYILSGMN